MSSELVLLVRVDIASLETYFKEGVLAKIVSGLNIIFRSEDVKFENTYGGRWLSDWLGSRSKKVEG